MPIHSSLLQFRIVKEPTFDKHFYVPDVDPTMIKRNVFLDRETQKFYGLADVSFCYANA